jgi:tRNA (guanine37-N1)-methyltransferase
LGDDESNKQDSFAGLEPLLEFEQYTRPREYRGHEVPDVLLNGNHVEIAEWRRQRSLQKTHERRADLLSGDRPRTN